MCEWGPIRPHDTDGSLAPSVQPPPSPVVVRLKFTIVQPPLPPAPLLLLPLPLPFPPANAMVVDPSDLFVFLSMNRATRVTGFSDLVWEQWVIGT